MKKTRKRLFSLILVAVMMTGFALTTSAAEKGAVVTYGNETFTFAPGSEYSVSDLFPGFKNLMPGDSITQTVRLVNNGKDGTTTKFYIKALGPTAEDNEDLKYSPVNPDKLGNGTEDDGYTDKPLYQELLKEIKLTVRMVNGDKKLFEAPADQTAQLTEWTHLGDLRKGGEIDLEVTLTLPLDIGGPEVDDNQFQNVAAALDWAFKIEEIPDPAPVVPDTGDNTGVMLYGAMFGMAALALFAIIVLKKRTKEE